MLMTIFDKSFVHSINADEAAVFDMHFMSNMTPLFFVEVLADLEKSDITDEAARQKLVSTLAGKTPSMRCYSNIPHDEIAMGELLGFPVDIRGVPVIRGGRRVQSSEGLGTVYEKSPESLAAERWHRGQFGEDEYRSARRWREFLAHAPESIEEFTGASPARFSFKDLATVKRFAESIIDRSGARHKTLRAALEMFNISSYDRPKVIARWKKAGGPPLAEFAPYARHVMLVEFFRTFAMASGHIDPDKSSNFADMAYLFYLPFCQAFISGDKLHRRVVPLFLREDQQFAWAHDLRAHLAELATTYLADPALPDLGLIGVSSRTKLAKDSYIGAMFERAHPGQPAHEASLHEKLSPEVEREIVERLKAAAEAPPPKPDADLNDEDVNTTFVRSVPRQRGRFPMMPRNLM
jgi:hypothetical protein